MGMKLLLSSLPLTSYSAAHVPQQATDWNQPIAQVLGMP